MKTCVSLLFTLLTICCSNAQTTFFEGVDNFLVKYVSNGEVDYERIQSDLDELNDLVDQIEETTLKYSPAEDRKAFLINSYNILVIKGVIENYPIKSPLEVKGFFDQKKYNVAGELLTLNEIENKKIREVFKDPRIHFALVCAAQGCPKLIPEAYFPSELNGQLKKKTLEELNDNQFIRVNDDQKNVKVSEIFKWYNEDFGGSENVISYLNKFRSESIPEDYTLDYYEYDWSLNVKK